MDAYRRGDRFFVHLVLPGVDPNSIELTCEQNVLTVRMCSPSVPSEAFVFELTEGLACGDRNSFVHVSALCKKWGYCEDEVFRDLIPSSWLAREDMLAAQ
jgi:hypothetical protein